MDKEMYAAIPSHMLSCMGDSAHDKEHIYRVLHMALDLAGHEGEDVDRDILTAAALLHDIGREDQFRDPSLCHAEAGSVKAYDFLLSLGWDEERAGWVRACILTHRYRSDRPPQSIEAKLLFDADKLDVTGAIGIARTLYYGGAVGSALYSLDEHGLVLDGTETGPNTFLQEYRHKLEHIGEKLYTSRAREIAAGRKQAAQSFYENLLAEIRGCR